MFLFTKNKLENKENFFKILNYKNLFIFNLSTSSFLVLIPWVAFGLPLLVKH